MVAHAPCRHTPAHHLHAPSPNTHTQPDMNKFVGYIPQQSRKNFLTREEFAPNLKEYLMNIIRQRDILAQNICLIGVQPTPILFREL